MSDQKIEPYYQARGKQLVDALFDKGYFRDDVSRDGMQDVEDLLAFHIQLTAESAARTAVLVKRVKDRGAQKP